MQLLFIYNEYYILFGIAFNDFYAADSEESSQDKPKFESGVFTPAFDECRIKPKWTNNPILRCIVIGNYNYESLILCRIISVCST